MAVSVENRSREMSSGPSPFDLDSGPGTQGKRRLPEVLVGALLVTLFALGGVWLYTSSTESTNYMFLASDVARGTVVTASDFAPFPLNAEFEIPTAIPEVNRADLEGKVAVADLSSGALASSNMFGDQVDIPPGHGIVGLALTPGQFPSQSFGPGDRVRVLTIDSTGEGLPVAKAEADNVRVFEVVPSGDGRFVSLVLPSDIADRVAAAQSAGAVRLVQVPAEG